MKLHPSQLFSLILILSPLLINAQDGERYKLVWSDEFNKKGRPDSTKWDDERGIVRNEELQWYQSENASVKKKES